MLLCQCFVLDIFLVRHECPVKDTEHIFKPVKGETRSLRTEMTTLHCHSFLYDWSSVVSGAALSIVRSLVRI